MNYGHLLLKQLSWIGWEKLEINGQWGGTDNYRCSIRDRERKAVHK